MPDKPGKQKSTVEHDGEAAGTSSRASRGRTPGRKGIGWLEVLISLVGLVLLTALITLAPALLGFSLAQGWGTVVIASSSGPAALLAVGAAFLARRRFTLASVGLQHTTGRWLLAGAGLGALVYAINFGGVQAYTWITGENVVYLSRVAGVLPALPFALLVLGVAVFVPFGEELVFRGVLYTWLRRWGVVVAVVVSSGLFGLAHLSIDVDLVVRVLLGVVAAVAYERSGSLWPAVLVHGVYNALIYSTIPVLGLLGL